LAVAECRKVGNLDSVVALVALVGRAGVRMESGVDDSMINIRGSGKAEQDGGAV
jgi:hypothetical protein